MPVPLNTSVTMLTGCARKESPPSRCTPIVSSTCPRCAIGFCRTAKRCCSIGHACGSCPAQRAAGLDSSAPSPTKTPSNSNSEISAPRDFVDVDPLEQLHQRLEQQLQHECQNNWQHDVARDIEAGEHRDHRQDAEEDRVPVPRQRHLTVVPASLLRLTDGDAERLSEAAPGLCRAFLAGLVRILDDVQRGRFRHHSSGLDARCQGCGR